MDLAGNRQSHFTQSALACRYRIKHDKVHQRRGQKTIRCQLEVVLVDGVHTRRERHADRNHLGCRAQRAGNTRRAILLKSSHDVERHRQLERVLNIRQQRYHISRRHGDVRRARGQIRMAERINFVSSHISNGSVGAPTDIAANQFDINGGTRLQLAPGGGQQVPSACATAGLHRHEAKRAKQRRELLKRRRRTTRNQQRRLDAHQRRSSNARRKSTTAQQGLGQQ